MPIRADTSLEAGKNPPKRYTSQRYDKRRAISYRNNLAIVVLIPEEVIGIPCFLAARMPVTRSARTITSVVITTALRGANIVITDNRKASTDLKLVLLLGTVG